MIHNVKLVFRVEDADTKAVIVPDSQTVLHFHDDEMNTLVREAALRGVPMQPQAIKEKYVATIMAAGFMVVTKFATTKITDWIGKVITAG